MDHKLKWRDFSGGYQQNYPSHNNKKSYFTPVNSIPPTTQTELEGLVIDYLTCNPDMKIDSFTLLRNIRSCYRNTDNSVYVFKTLSINDAVRDLYYHGLIDCKETFIGLKRAYFITKVDEEKLKIYKAENGENFTISSNSEKYNEISKKIAANFLN